MRSKSKTPKHLANQGGRDDRRRARRAAIGATVLVAAIAVLLAVVPGLGVQASPAGQPGQQASVGTAPQQGDAAGTDVEQASASPDAAGGADEPDGGLPDGGGKPAPGDSGQGATEQASDEPSAPAAPMEEEVGGATCEGGVVLVPIPDGATVEDVTSMLAGVDAVDAQSVEGQDLSLGFVRVQTKPGITVADTVDQLSAAGVRSQPNYSYSVGEGEDEAPDAQAGAIGSTVASEGAPSDEAAEGGEALDRSATDVPAGATDPSGAAVPADGGNAGGTEEDPAGASSSDAAGDEAAGNAEAEPAFSTNDPDGLLSYSSWSAQAPVDLRDAWGVTRTDKRVTIAVLDTGCRVTHEDLRDNIVDTFDATKANKSNDLPGDVSDVTDVNGHGTHVAGIASARADNGKGVAGTSYNAGLSIVKIFPSYDVRDEATGVRKLVGHCYTDDMVIGYKHVLETRSAHNIRVVNMSIQGSRGDGFSDGDELLNDQVKAAYDAGIVTVCCAGNTNGNKKEDGSSSLPYRSFPVDLDSEVVGVMNLLGPNELSGDSNYNTDGQEYGGTNKNISAPGTSVYSTTYGSDSSYGTMSGTSMATPYVAGVVALEFSTNPSLSPRQAMDVLYDSADDVSYTGEGWDDATGYGSVNACRAVMMAKGTRDISAATAPLTLWAKGTSPDPVVTYGYEDGEPITLRSGTDYTVAYKDNGNGTATRTITGKGRFSGRKVDTCPSVDQQVDVSSCTFEADWACPGYRPIVKGKATVRSSSGEDVSCELVEGQDFRVTSGPTGDGGWSATYTVEGVGAFTGSKTQNDFIGTQLYNLTDEQTHTGSALEPVPVLYDPKRNYTLVLGKDYKVTGYERNVDVGYGVFDVKGLGYYCFEWSFKFDIVDKKDVGGDGVVTLHLPRDTYTYTGSPIKPTVTVFEGTDTTKSLRVKWADVDEWDYTVDYKDNVNVGTGAVVVSGSGKYKGTKAAPFKIVPRDLSGAKVSASDQTFTGGELRPSPTVTLDGRTLAAGTDYDVSYSDNVNPGTATVTVTGKGNYTGTTRGTFAIAPSGDSPDNPPSFKPGVYAVTPAANESVTLDVSGAGGQDGANVQLYRSNRSYAQMFCFRRERDGAYSVMALCSGKYLDVSAGSHRNGANVQQWTWNGSDAQLWYVEPAGNDAFKLVNKGSGKVLDVNCGSLRSGENVQQWEANGTAAQAFKLSPASSVATISPATARGYALDISGASTASGANVQIYKKNGTNAQRFYVTNVAGDGTRAIISTLANNALDAAGDGRGNGTNVQSYRYNGTPAQHWFVQYVGKRGDAPAYRILGASSGLALDVSAGVFSSGRNVQLWGWNSSAAQVWAIEFER